MDPLFRLQNFEIVNLSRIFESISYAYHESVCVILNAKQRERVKKHTTLVGTINISYNSFTNRILVNFTFPKKVPVPMFSNYPITHWKRSTRK